MKNIFKNRVALSQTESCFIDFKRKTFPEMARNQYHLIYEAHRRKDKVDLMKLLSVPLFDVYFILFRKKINIFIIKIAFQVMFEGKKRFAFLFI